jgi:hypothetical protein
MLMHLREGVPIRDARPREAAGHCWIRLAYNTIAVGPWVCDYLQIGWNLGACILCLYCCFIDPITERPGHIRAFKLQIHLLWPRLLLNQKKFLSEHDKL